MKKILFFTAPWCPGCKTLKPHLAKLQGKVEIEEINVDERPAEAESCGVTNLPTLFFVQDGELVRHRTGASEAVLKEIYRFVEE